MEDSVARLQERRISKRGYRCEDTDARVQGRGYRNVDTGASIQAEGNRRKDAVVKIQIQMPETWVQEREYRCKYAERSIQERIQDARIQ